MQKPPGPPPPNTSRPDSLEINEPVHTVGIALDQIILPPQVRDEVTGGLYGLGAAGTYNQNRITIEYLTNTLEQEFQARSKQLQNSIEIELSAIRSESPSKPATPAQSIVCELGVLHTLWQRKSAKHHTKTVVAIAFYGADPFSRNINDFMLKATKIETWPGPNGIAMQALEHSLRAAIETRLLLQTLGFINQQIADLERTLNTLHVAEQVQRTAEQ